MTYTVSITSQGQISIPAKIQRELGLSKKKKALVSVQNGKMVVEPIKDFLGLKGSLKSSKLSLTSQQIHEAFAKHTAEEYIRDK